MFLTNWSCIRLVSVDGVLVVCAFASAGSHRDPTATNVSTVHVFTIYRSLGSQPLLALSYFQIDDVPARVGLLKGERIGELTRFGGAVLRLDRQRARHCRRCARSGHRDVRESEHQTLLLQVLEVLLG